MSYTYQKIKPPFDGEPECLVKRKEDGVLIPFDEGNTDYQEYLVWVAEGNTAEAADQTGQLVKITVE